MKTETAKFETRNVRTRRRMLHCALALAFAFAASAACGGEPSPNPKPNPAPDPTPKAKNEPTRFGKTVAEWLAVIENAEPQSMDLTVAALALSQFGPEAGDAIESAAREGVDRYVLSIEDAGKLDDKDFQVQYRLMFRLGVMGRALACDPDRMFARAFAIAAPRKRDTSKDAFPGLLPCSMGAGLVLKGMMELPGSRRFLSRALADGLRHPDAEVRAFCQQVTSSIGGLLRKAGVEPDFTLLNAADARALLASGDLYPQLCGAGILSKVGEDRTSVVPLLQRAFREGDDLTASLALEIMLEKGAGAAPAADAFAEWLAKREQDAALLPALDAVFQLGPVARSCMPHLRRIAEAGSPLLGGKALLALARISAPGDAETGKLLERQDGPGAPARALARAVFKNDPKGLAAFVFEQLDKGDYELEDEALGALVLAQDEARRLALERLESEDAKVRRSGLRAAGVVRVPDADLLRAVAQHVGAEGLDGIYARVALLRYGEAATVAIPFISETFGETDAEGAESLARVLQAIGRAGVPALAAVVLTERDEIALPVLKVLRAMEADAAEARGAVLQRIGVTNDPSPLMACLATLAAMGPADEPTRAALVKAAQCPVLPVRVAACDALRWTGGDPSPYWTLKEETPEARRARLQSLDEDALLGQIEYGMPEHRGDGIAEVVVRGKLQSGNVAKLVNLLRKASAEERAAVKALLLKVGAPAVTPLIEVLWPDRHFPAFGHRGVGGRRRLAMRGGGTVESYLKELEEEQDPAKRAVAARMLGGMGAKSAPAVAALAKAARDENDELSVAALEALGKIGVQDTAAVEAAKESFDNAKRVDAAAVALKALGGDPAPQLSVRLDRPLGELPVRCAAQLVKLDAKHARAREVLHAALAARGADWTPVAVEALLALDDRRNATLSWLVDRLGDAETEAAGTDWGFEYARGELLALSYDSVPVVTRRLKSDPNAKIRAECAALLTGYSPPLESALFKLPVAFKDAEGEVRRRAVAGVRELLPRAYLQARPLLLPLVPDFVLLVTDQVFETRLDAVTVFGLLKPATDVAVPPLARALKDERAEVRAASAHALGQLQWGKSVPMCEEAMQALAGVFHDPDSGVRREALFAAAEINPEHHAFAQAADVLVELLESTETDNSEKERVCKILECVGAPAVGPLFDAVMRRFDGQK